jgi:hypothetical protein
MGRQKNVGLWSFYLPVALIALVAGSAIGLAGSWWPVLAGLALLVLAFLLPRYGVLGVLAGAALPFAPVLAVPIPGIRIALADVLAVLAIVSFLAVARLGRLPLARPVRPGLLVAALFGLLATLTTLWTAAPAMTEFAEIAQRVEIVIVWLLFGVLAVRAGLLRRVLNGYVAACLVISALWIATPGVGSVLGMQKNPSGGFIASAVLVVLLSDLPNRRRLPILVVLAGGLVASGSRGSIVGLVAAVGALLLLARHWRRTVLPLAALCAATGGILLLLPPEIQDRLLSRNADGVYTTRIREVLLADALQQFERSPEGVGIGAYQQRASALQNIGTHDPHNVLILHLVEGGWLLLGAFVLLAGGSLLWMLRLPKTPLTVMALAVQVSILAHAFVDVYWARGTPSLGWLLVGAAAAAAVGAEPLGGGPGSRGQQRRRDRGAGVRGVGEPSRDGAGGARLGLRG